MDEAAVLRRLVARYSPSGQEGAAVDEFLRIARALGFRAVRDAVGNGVAVRGRGRPRLLFLGHIDTVEGRRPVRLARGRLHGRGAVDAKGALASALVAGSRFAGPGTLRVVAAVREETDSRGARHLLRGPRPDAVIAGEPSGWQGVTIGYKGDLRLEVRFRQRRTHWSGPAPTAADLATAWIARARATVAPDGAESPFRSTSFKVVGFAAHPSDDPEDARLTVDIRLPPGRSAGSVLAALPSEPGDPSVRTTVEIPAVERPRTDPVVRALVDGVRRVRGEPTLLRKSGTSDLNLVVARWGIPGAAYGPGDARLDHTDRESVAVEELRRASDVLAVALARLAGRDGGLTPPRSVSAP